jgi:hypothetical protein
VHDLRVHADGVDPIRRVQQRVDVMGRHAGGRLVLGQPLVQRLRNGGSS